MESPYTKPHRSVPFVVDPAKITKVMMDVFFEFFELPEGIKNTIDLKISPLHRRNDVGVKHREAEDSIYSHSKDFFHFHPIIFKNHENFLTRQAV